MTKHRGSWLILVAMFFTLITSAVCTKPQGEAAQANSPATQPAVAARPVPLPARPKPAAPPIAAPIAASPKATSPTIVSPGDEPLYTLEFKPKPGDVLYLTIDNEYRDSGGVQPLLTYSTSLKERRCITQKVLDKIAAPNPLVSASKLSKLEWECDRYEAREKAMKDEVVFDSLRHLYPPPSLYNLGAIPGSKCTFLLDANGQASDISISPAAMTGEPGRGTPSKTIEKCLLSIENIRKLLDDLGPAYFPRQPVGVGAQWTYKMVDVQRNIGTFTTLVKCSLRSMKDIEGRKIAQVDIAGDISLAPESLPAPPTPATTRPGHPATSQNKSREFKLDKAAYTGQVDFDLTRGEIVQLTLRREQGVAAELDGQAMGPMQLKTAWSHVMKFTASHQPTPQPVIVGGKKPPVIPKEDQPRGGPAMAARPGTTTQPRSATTRPTMSQARPAPPQMRRPPFPTSQSRINAGKPVPHAPDNGSDPPPNRRSPRPVTSMSATTPRPATSMPATTPRPVTSMPATTPRDTHQSRPAPQ